MNKFIVSMLFSGVIFIGAGWWFVSNQEEKVLQTAMEEEKALVAEYLRGKAMGTLSSEVFQSGGSQEREVIFSAYWELIQSPEYIRIKIWDTNFTLLWADMKELIGQRFPDNHEMEEALEGEVELEIDDFRSLENEKERQLFRTAEVYVPLYEKQGKEVIGVIEIYKTANFLDRVDQMVLKMTFSVIIVLLTMYSVLAVMLHRFFKKTRSSRIV